jgi:hypothetical protein
MPKVGLEPTPTCVDRILSPARLPFRHFGALRLAACAWRLRQKQCQHTRSVSRGQDAVASRSRGHLTYAVGARPAIQRKKELPEPFKTPEVLFGSS